MEHHVGIDVSLELSSLCVLDTTGRSSGRRRSWSEFAKLHREVLAIVKEDPVCRRLTTAPGVGAVVSLTYRAGVDDPGRFATSKSIGAFFGLTPKRYQSGETDVTGAIARVGDAGVRTALHDAANALLTRAAKFSTLKRWALARKLATVLHRIWVDGTEFVWGKDPAAAAAA
jgi:transposase